MNCDYCTKLKLSSNQQNSTQYGQSFYDDYSGSGEFSVGRKKDGFYILHFEESHEGYTADTPIEYCPKCGRKLDQDALTLQQMQKLIDDAPDKCPITGLRKCTSYLIDNNVVYCPDPAYDAYTLPTYDPETKSFYRTRYDMDDDNREEDEWLCDLEELQGRCDYEDIKKFYNITDD